MPTYVPLPRTGRTFTAERRVRLGDSAPSGRVRFDAIARYLQDVAEDDANDAGWPKSIGWLLRRCVVHVRRFPSVGEGLQLVTFCSGTAQKWAERTTMLTGNAGGSVQATAVWIAVDAQSGRPTRLGELFERLYAPSADGHRASARLSIPPPTAQALAQARNWPIRSTDLDLWGHVNNAISWAAVEDAIHPLDWLPVRAEVEHNEAINLSDAPLLAEAASDAGCDAWLVAAGHVLTSARLLRS
jgi:acyl-ACP thioesterase